MEAHRDHLLRLLLENALSHQGEPSQKAVMGKVMADLPELRSRAGDVKEWIANLASEVSARDLAGQQAWLEELGGVVTREGRPRRVGLPDLPDLPEDRSKTVFRFAPGPSGPLHLGHTRMAILNDEYAKCYGGKLILRLEDTNPAAIIPEAYAWIEKDMETLECKVSKRVVQSDHFPRFHEVGKTLLEQGNAYVCTCEQEVFKALKQASRPCPHREQEEAERLSGWEGMQGGDFGPGEATVMLKADLEHRDEALRDFPILRISETEHVRTHDRFRVYPLMNLAVPVDDHDLGLTHVIRGKDHLTNTRRQEFIYRHLGWKPPTFTHPGFVRIEGTILKTSLIKEGIAKGDYEGWDDYRLGTVQALIRRGISPKAIRKVWVDAGIKEAEISFDWQNLYAANLQKISKVPSNFLTGDFELIMDFQGTSNIDLGPYIDEFDIRADKGSTFNTGSTFINSEELPAPGELFRFKGKFNLRLESRDENGAKAVWHSWTPPEGSLITDVQHTGAYSTPLRILKPDNTEVRGWVAQGFVDQNRGKVVRFERLGYCRILQDGDVALWTQPL